MPDTRVLFPNVLGGQNDTRVAEGTELPRWVTVTNSRLRDGTISRRPGMKRIAVCGTDATAFDFVAASSHYAEFPAPAHMALTFPVTFEWLFEPDDYTGAHTLVGFNHATDWPFRVWTSGGTIKLTLTDSAGTAETIDILLAAGVTTERFAVQVAIKADGTYTDTVHALHTSGAYATYATSGPLSIGTTLKAPGGVMYFGRDASGNYFDGEMDYFRVYRYAATDFNMAWSRWPSPRQPYMLCDYAGEKDSNGWVFDRSPFENHGEVKNSLGTTTAHAINPAPVQAMRTYRDKDHKTKLLLIAGGRVHSAEL